MSEPLNEYRVNALMNVMYREGARPDSQPNFPADALGLSRANDTARGNWWHGTTAVENAPRLSLRVARKLLTVSILRFTYGSKVGW